MGTTRRSRTIGLGITAMVITAANGVTTGPLGATSPRTWWVATSGTVATPGTSCANPDHVGDTHAPIQAALTAAVDGDTVHICAGTYAIDSTLTVDEDVTITGDGVTATILDGGSANRIMSIDWSVSDTTGATVDDIQFRNGRSGGNGGAIEVHREAKVTITSSLFRNNIANGYGGAVAISPGESMTYPGVVHISDSTFYDNIGLQGGGAVSTRGFLNPAPTITNSTFVGNYAGSEGGGAITSAPGLTLVSHSTFLDNRAVDNGSATNNTLVSNSVLATSTPSDVAMCVAGTPSSDLIANVTTDGSCNGSGGSVTTAALDLRFLAPWGGATPTVALGANSSAIGAVTSNCASTDQRGISRGAPCDAGAFEYEAGAATLTPDRMAIPMVPGDELEPYTAPAVSGLTSPVYRLATEISAPLPAGITLSGSDGRLSGTPTTYSSGRHLVITVSDANGAVASMQIDTCPLIADQAGVHAVATPADLEVFEVMACGLDTDYRLTGDISWNAPWTSVGSSDRPFTGTFDGGGHTISGLQISGGWYSAFISYARQATITSLTLAGDVAGDYGSSLLVGFSDDVDVVDTHGSGTVTGVSGTHECIGGLAGDFLFGSTMTDSSFSGTVLDPTGTLVGGLVGCALWPATITRSSFDGSVTGNDWVGGLVGWLAEAEIIDSFAVGEVTAVATAGGLVGWQDVDGPDFDQVAVSNSYANVALDGAGPVGGLIGSGESAAIEASFWAAGLATSGALTAIGAAHDLAGNPTAGTAATDPDDLRSFAFLDAAGWAIVDGWADPATSSDVWGVCERMGLPFHLARHTTNPCVEPPAEPEEPSTPAPVEPTDPTPDEPTDPTPDEPTDTDPTPDTDTDTDETAPTTVPSTTTPTTSVPADTTTTATETGPALRAGELAVYVDGQAVEPAMTWATDGSLTIRIGDTQIGIGLDQGTTGTRGRLRPGRPLRFNLAGLRPSSSAVATLFSTPTRLGELAADADGTVAGTMAVPDRVEAGEHRMRLEVVDSAGRAIEVWLGVDVQPSDVQLPATGGLPPITPAAVLVLTGLALLGSARRRATGDPG